MGRRRGTGMGVLACALALAAAGCGVETHVNAPRPQPATRVSVTVTEDEVTVQPSRIAIGPEPTQQLPQNAHTTQPPVRSNAPLDVVLVGANLTDFDSRIEVRGRRKQVRSKLWVANGNISMQTDLPTGVYLIGAADIPSAKPAKLVVGPYRTSSQNDLLLP